MREKLPKPPAHLSPARRRLWAEIVEAYRVEDRAGGLELLRLALEALDEADAARAAVAEHGLLISGRYGDRQNPAVAIGRDAALRAARLLRELNVDVAEVPETRLPTRWRQ